MSLDRLAKLSIPTSAHFGRCISFSSRGTLSQLSRYILLFSFSSGQLVKRGPRAGVVGELPFIPGPHPPTPTEVVAVHQCFVVKKLGKCQIRSHPLGGGLLITLPIELLIELKPNGSTTGLATLLDLLNSDLAGVIRKRSWDRCESTAGAVAAARPVPLLGDPAAREPCFRVGERGDAVTRRCAVITYNPLSPNLADLALLGMLFSWRVVPRAAAAGGGARVYSRSKPFGAPVRT
jgi:hypothetical protein